MRKAYGVAQTKILIVSLLSDAVTVIDCDHTTTLLSLHSTMTDIEDALQYFTALKHGADYFISSDLDFQKRALAQLPVISAEAYLKLPNN